MSRRLFLDRSAGEARGVVTLDGKPERLMIARDTEIACQTLGAISTARVSRIERGLGTAFLTMPKGRDAVMPLKAEQHLVEGASLEVEVATEAREGKGAVVRLIGPSSGPPRLIAEGPDIEARLTEVVAGVPVTTGEDAREAADEAQDAALAKVHPIPGGGSIAIEPTRALVAIDVDLGMRGGADAQRAARAANLAAVATAARLLRLKGLGGLVVFDLAGKGHDGAAIAAEAKRAFAPDGGGVAIGPISRFGLFELAIPRTAAPVTERLADAAGAPTAETVALSLFRAIEREARSNPGALILANAAPDVIAAAKPFEAMLAAKLGPRFTLKADAARSRGQFDVSPR